MNICQQCIAWKDIHFQCSNLHLNEFIVFHAFLYSLTYLQTYPKVQVVLHLQYT